MAALFQIENSTELEQLTRVVANVVDLMHDDEWQHLRRAITEWLNRVVLPNRLPNQVFEPVHDLLETHAMLAETVKDWFQQWKEQGKEEGLREGKLEGKLEGEALVLQRLLQKRFGNLPEWAVTKLNTATLTELDDWSERIFDAQSLEAFFA